MKTKLITGLLLVALLMPVSALIVNVTGINQSFVYIQIGHGQVSSLGLFGAPAGMIDEVSFDFPVGTRPGDGVAISGTPVMPFLLIGSRTFFGFWVNNFRLTANTAMPLTNAGGDSIPFSEFSWTSRDGDIPNGRFNDSAVQNLNAFNPGWNSNVRGVIDYLTFSYDNDQIFAPGVYTGRVTYTITLL